MVECLCLKAVAVELLFDVGQKVRDANLSGETLGLHVAWWGVRLFAVRLAAY